MTLNEALRALIDTKAKAAGPFSDDWDTVEVPEGKWMQFSVWMFVGPHESFFDDVYLGEGSSSDNWGSLVSD